MENVSRVTCINNGGFIQEFRVCWDGGCSRWSGKYPNPQSRQIDLHDYNLPEGMEVWVEVHAILGKKKQAWEHVFYSSQSADAAVYRTTGTIWSVTVKLESY